MKAIAVLAFVAMAYGLYCWLRIKALSPSDNTKD